MERSGDRATDLLGAAMAWAPIVLIDGFLLTRIWGTRLSLLGTVLLLGPMLLGAAVGAATARRHPTTARRWLRAGVGALIGHALQLALLITLLMLFPPRIPW
ncbi:hypothetical protein ACIHEI_23885 [Kitasatospora sp. NPDC051984]|uniref:hypothetical protein n=1 Tax=Kitasatospora sp. NPDC051984 TaxID=3364059 RepID=UPI0037CA42DA